MRKYQFLFSALILLLSLAWASFSQTPEPQSTPPEDDINITTEEIKLNISAVTDRGFNAIGLAAEDVVINENGRLHQAASLRKIPANVLILLDVGNEISYAKRSKITAAAARNLVNALQTDDSIAVMQYGDKVEILSDWTRAKDKLVRVLADNKIGFGRHSRFNLALQTAIDFFDRTPLENRHLILITDGIDSLNNPLTKTSVTKRLLSSDINVHVISYTTLQKKSIKGDQVAKYRGSTRPKLPPGVGLPEYQRFPSVGVSINMDREMIRHRKKEVKKLEASEEYLIGLAKDTNGEIFIPETPFEMTDKMGNLARYIDSQYVVTYTPKDSLADAPEGEIRNIRVTSRKSGVFISSSRRYVVSKELSKDVEK